MKENTDPEGAMASLAQEATNQSTPDKSLGGGNAERAPRLKPAPKRDKLTRVVRPA
jgi:hypothetical protein